MTRFTASVTVIRYKHTHVQNMSIALLTRQTKLELDIRVIGHVVFLGFVRHTPWRVLLVVRSLLFRSWVAMPTDETGGPRAEQEATCGTRWSRCRPVHHICRSNTGAMGRAAVRRGESCLARCIATRESSQFFPELATSEHSTANMTFALQTFQCGELRRGPIARRIRSEAHIRAF